MTAHKGLQHDSPLGRVDLFPSLHRADQCVQSSSCFLVLSRSAYHRHHAGGQGQAAWQAWLLFGSVACCEAGC